VCVLCAFGVSGMCVRVVCVLFVCVRFVVCVLDVVLSECESECLCVWCVWCVCVLFVLVVCVCVCVCFYAYILQSCSITIKYYMFQF